MDAGRQSTTPAQRAVTLEGEVVRVTYESNDTGFRVLKVATDTGARTDDLETLVGYFPPAPPGTRVRITGKRVRDPKFGDQIKVESLLLVQPSTLAGLEKYLASGAIPGIGPAYAKRIVKTFGRQVLDVLDREPARLREVDGLGVKRAQVLAKAWADQRAIGGIMVFLQSHGVTPAIAARIHKRFGTDAIDVVSRHPYRLAFDVWGIGFKTADAIARSVGVGADSPERAQAGLLHVLHELAARGHVLALRRDLVERAAAMLELDLGMVDEAIDALATAALVKVEGAGDDTAVYTTDLYEAEVRVARRLADLLHAPAAGPSAASIGRAVDDAIAAFEKHAKVSLDPAQRAAVEAIAQHKVLVVTGGPGVGKTTIVRAMLAAMRAARVDVRLAAPTGRAAKRMTEATGQDAVTLHRLLEFDPRQRLFNKDREEPIDAGLIIVDETSMLDLPLADALFDAVPTGSRLVLVGDVDQLPSVGPGAVLRDVIGSGVVPTVRLHRIFRQAERSLIVENAHRIHAGEPPQSARGKDGDFYIVARNTPEEAADLIRELVTKRMPEAFGLDPVRDVQVLVPMHRGPAGTTALNELLQTALNPTGPSIIRGRSAMRAGDKVMQLRNDYEKEVFNGDVGVVALVDPAARRMLVRFEEREVVYEESDFDALTLAYATSIHKSQGSEYPAVVVPLLTQHFVMLSRNLLYTAVTRGKRLVVLVADPRALALALAETRKEDRRTRLAARLRAAAG